MQSLIGGMNSGLDPALLPLTQYSFGVNVSSRSGLVHTRPVFESVAVVQDGIFQGGDTYSWMGIERIVYAISGRLYSITLADSKITDHGEAMMMSATALRCVFCQVDRYMVVQDGVSVPVIIEGDVARRADQSTEDSTQKTGFEVPIGTIMAYGQGRLFVKPTVLGSGADGSRSFYAGDIQIPESPATVLQFTETEYLSGGGSISLPSDMGQITGMCFMRNAGTGSGVGALIVFGERGVSAFAVSAPRADWSNIDISQVLFQDVGSFSPFSMTPVNSDIYFRSQDGIRSLSYSTTEAKSSGSNAIFNVPLSFEATTILENDTLGAMRFTEMAFVNNRVYCLSVPADTTFPAFRAMISLDAESVGSISSPTAPIYDGVWTGYNFMALAVASKDGYNALYAFINRDGHNELAYLNEAVQMDPSGLPTLCRVETRNYDFSFPTFNKTLGKVVLDLTQVVGDGSITVYYRPNGYPFWAPMNTFQIKAPSTGRPQLRQGVVFTPTTPDLFRDPSTNNLLCQSKAFQFCIEWNGVLQIDAATFFAHIESETPHPGCSSMEQTDVPLMPDDRSGVELNPYEWNAGVVTP